MRKSRVSKLARGRVGAKSTKPKWTGRVQITGSGRDERGSRYVGLKVGRKAQVFLPIDAFDRAAFRQLNNKGAHIITEAARQELMQRVQSSPPTGKLRPVATRLGAHGPCFVLPRKIYRPSSSSTTDLVNAIDRDLEFYTRFRVAKSAKGWNKLMRIIRRNSRMLLALGVMLVGPLALVCAFEQVAIQFVGDPVTGKTAIGAVTSTVWGYNVELKTRRRLRFRRYLEPHLESARKTSRSGKPYRAVPRRNSPHHQQTR